MHVGVVDSKNKTFSSVLTSAECMQVAKLLDFPKSKYRALPNTYVKGCWPNKAVRHLKA